MIENLASVSSGIILSVCAILGLVAKFFFDLNKNKSFENQFSAITVKVDALWEVYMMDAVREARVSRLTQSHSPDSPTEEFNNIFNGRLREIIIEDLKLMKYNTKYDQTDLIIFNIWEKHRDALGQFCESHDMKISSLLGAIKSLINEI